MSRSSSKTRQVHVIPALASSARSCIGEPGEPHHGQCNRLENDCKHVSVVIMWNHLPEAQNHDPGRPRSQIDTLYMCTYVLSINDSKIPADMAPEIVRNPQSDWETPMLT